MSRGRESQWWGAERLKALDPAAVARCAGGRTSAMEEELLRERVGALKGRSLVRYIGARLAMALNRRSFGFFFDGEPIEWLQDGCYVAPAGGGSRTDTASRVLHLLTSKSAAATGTLGKCAHAVLMSAVTQLQPGVFVKWKMSPTCRFDISTPPPLPLLNHCNSLQTAAQQLVCVGVSADTLDCGERSGGMVSLSL